MFPGRDLYLTQISRMKLKRPRIIFFCALVIFAGAGIVTAQRADKQAADEKQSPLFRSSPAYAELVLRRTEITSELESLVLDYTEDYPKVKEIRFVVILIERDIARIGKVKPAESSKLTLALGKLMVRKIELETDVWNLQRTYKEEHPDVKRARRRVEIYEAAINDILN